MDKNSILLSIILGIVIIFMISINNKINKLNDEFMVEFRNNQVDIVNRLNSEFNSIRYSINELKNDNQWIDNSSFSFKSITDDKAVINTEFNVSFKELYNSSKVYLLIVNVEDEDDFIKFELEQVNNLHFKGEIGLDVNKNYFVDLVSENSVLNKKVNLMNLYVKDKLSHRYDIPSSGAGYSIEDETIHLSYNFTLLNSHYGLDDMKLTDINIKLYNGLTLIKEIDELNLLKNNEMNNQTTSYIFSDKSTFPKGTNGPLNLEIVIEDNLGESTLSVFITSFE